MGLDMYLYKRSYVQNWEHHSKDERYSISILKGGMDTHIKPERISYVEEHICYWRKFNALHNWFVQNKANGVDNCQPVLIGSDDLSELLSLLEKVYTKISENDVDGIKELFPPTQGFFFGSTEIDDSFKNDVRITIQDLKNILKEEKEHPNAYVSYIYSASW